MASEAGADVLRGGGTAIEAAVAMSAVLAVSNPHFCGLGGDAVWLLCDTEGYVDTLLGIGQGIGAAPADGPIPLRGPGSVLTTACLIDSWEKALARSAEGWQGKLGLEELLSPAIEFAENGVPITPSQRFWTEQRRHEMSGWPGFARIFLDDNLSRRRLRQPELADSLRAIGLRGAREFYEGALGERIAKGLEAVGARLRASDLRATESRWAVPLHLDYRGLTLFAPPLPTQGLTTLEIMGTLRMLDFTEYAAGSADHYHLVIEAIKRAFLDRDGIADPDFGSSVDHRRLLAADHLESLARGIELRRAMPWTERYRSGDTVYLGAVDREGRCVSLLQSIYFDWGSGVVAGDTGILWQNRGAAFNPDPSHSNAFRPGKRPFYTLNPGLALRGGRAELLYGTQGADGQPQTLALLLTALIDYGLSVDGALRLPRFLLGKTFSSAEDTLKIEEDVGASVMTSLADRGHDLAPIGALSPLAGQAGVILLSGDRRSTGAHDPRGSGLAVTVG